jgi:hypothetical protein
MSAVIFGSSIIVWPCVSMTMMGKLDEVRVIKESAAGALILLSARKRKLIASSVNGMG